MEESREIERGKGVKEKKKREKNVGWEKKSRVKSTDLLGLQLIHSTKKTTMHPPQPREERGHLGGPTAKGGGVGGQEAVSSRPRRWAVPPAQGPQTPDR